MNEREQVAKAIWGKRPDCQGKPWPLETERDRRAYPHSPIAAADLCLIYADAALEALGRTTAPAGGYYSRSLTMSRRGDYRPREPETV